MTKKRNISAFIGLCLLVGLSGCAKKNKNKKVNPKKSVATQVDIPTADNAESISRFFDSELSDFVAVDDENNVKSSQAQNNQAEAQDIAPELNVAQNSVDLPVDLSETSNDYNLGEQNVAQKKDMRTIYFEFDQHAIQEDQVGALNINVSKVEAVLEKARQNGEEPVIVIESHACHSAGSRSYNLAKSLQRAQAIADYLVNNGVSRENIKIVGRGDEMPAVINGNKVTGSREEQWPNRRSEIQVI